MSGDEVTIYDASYIQKYLVSLPVPYPVGDMFNRATGDPAETIEPTVIADTNGVKVTANSFSRGFVPMMNLTVENSGDKEVELSFYPLIVNGFQTSADFISQSGEDESYQPSVLLAPHSSSDYDLHFNTTLAEEEYMAFYTQICFNVRLIDPVTYQVIATQKSVINTSAYGHYDYEYDESGDVVYNDNGIKFIYKGLSDDGLVQPIFYISNQSDKDIVIRVKETGINGTEGEGVFGVDVFSGCRITASPGILTDTAPGDSVRMIFEICERTEDVGNEQVLYTTDPFTFTL